MNSLEEIAEMRRLLLHIARTHLGATETQPAVDDMRRYPERPLSVYDGANDFLRAIDDELTARPDCKD